MTTYRLVAIDNGIEHDAGLIDTLAMPPGAALVVRIGDTFIMTEAARLREVLMAALPDTPIVVIQGDVSFLRLVPAEAPCLACGQSPTDTLTGEYPCPACGLPRLHDEVPSDPLHALLHKLDYLDDRKRTP